MATMIRITAPAGSSFTGRVAGVAFADGVALLDPEAAAAALAYFRRRGYAVEDDRPAEPVKPARAPRAPKPAPAAPEPYDPHADGQGVPDVLAYLARGNVDETEATRVLDLEAGAAKPRVGITQHRDEILAEKRQAALDADTTGGTQ